MKTIKTKLNRKFIIGLIAGIFFLSSPLSFTQESDKFNPIAANAELDLLKRQIDGSDVSASFLNIARTQALNILNDASVCYERSSAERERLEIRFAPLKDIDADVSPLIGISLKNHWYSIGLEPTNTASNKTESPLTTD